jgi:hypothetical protein
MKDTGHSRPYIDVFADTLHSSCLMEISGGDAFPVQTRANKSLSKRASRNDFYLPDDVPIRPDG